MKEMINPLHVLSLKRNLQSETILNEQCWTMLLLRAIENQTADDNMEKQFSKRLVQWQIITARRQERRLYDRSVAGIGAYFKALKRAVDRNERVNLSTTERNAVRDIIFSYVDALPRLTRMDVAYAEQRYRELEKEHGAEG